MRRCAVSIPSNIAEGAGRNSSKEFARYLSISLGTLAELETQLIIYQNLKYATDAEIEKIIDELIVIRRMTVGLKKSLKF
jgi:four helix bundle protein